MANRDAKDRDWSRISRFFREESSDGDPLRLDDRTWADLDSVFYAVDRTGSSVGQALLYDMMRTPLRSEAELAHRGVKIRRFMENEGDRQRVRRVLTRLGTQREGEIYAFLSYVGSMIIDRRRFFFSFWEPPPRSPSYRSSFSG
jgi:hypothetical protein